MGFIPICFAHLYFEVCMSFIKKLKMSVSPNISWS